MPRAFILLLCLTAILTAGAAQADSARDAVGGRGWRLEPTPNPVGADISGLSSVACASGRACTAVGSFSDTLSSPTLTLAERWNGHRWQIQPTPAPEGATSDIFYGVSCPSARVCMAVGNAFYKTGHRMTNLAESWNGTQWRVQPTPTIKSPSSLYAVSCPTARSCTAVGFYHDSAGRTRAIVERWNGKTWRTQATPELAKSTMLSGVSCATVHACTAVGNQNGATGTARPLAESWNGKKWRVQTLPLPHGAPGGILEAVSCTSSRACTATGTDFDPAGPTLAERWNGKTWQVESTPNPANYQGSFGEVALDGVSCTSAKACTASGEYSPGGAAAYFVASWNGSRWRLVAAPHPADFERGALLGIACVSARCTAVGAYTGHVRLQDNLAMAK